MRISAAGDQSAFSLIELSIVLVIIGLIVGGILTGRDLMQSAGVRAQISQIEKYHTAVNTFRGKYGYLPGDIPDTIASRFGFQSRGPDAGEGDGNGILEGPGATSTTTYGYIQSKGENGVFWVDLSVAGLVDGSFNLAQSGGFPTVHPVTNIDTFFPRAKLERGNYVYVYSGGVGTDSLNYFGISAVTKIEDTPCTACVNSTPGMSVLEAYNIDKKADDGLPMSGKIRAFYLQEWPSWPAGGGGTGATSNVAATAASSTTCYDNGNSAGATLKYSTAQSSGNNINCALSFRFQ